MYYFVHWLRLSMEDNHVYNYSTLNNIINNENMCINILSDKRINV